MRSAVPVLESAIQDIRYGARLLRRSPWFTFVAMVSLAVGLGSSVGLFTLMNALLFRPLPGRDTAAIHSIHTSNSAGGRYGATSFADFQSFVAAAPELFAAACATTNVRGNLSAGTTTHAAPGALMSGGCSTPSGFGRIWDACSIEPTTWRPPICRRSSSATRCGGAAFTRMRPSSGSRSR